MKGNNWTPLIVVIILFFAIAIICLTVFQIKKLEYAHQEAMADKELAKMVVVEKRPELRALSHWDNFKSTIKKVFIELCPSVILRLLGF